MVGLVSGEIIDSQKLLLQYSLVQTTTNNSYNDLNFKQNISSLNNPHKGLISLTPPPQKKQLPNQSSFVFRCTLTTHD